MEQESYSVYRPHLWIAAVLVVFLLLIAGWFDVAMRHDPPAEEERILAEARKVVSDYRWDKVKAEEGAGITTLMTSGPIRDDQYRQEVLEEAFWLQNDPQNKRINEIVHLGQIYLVPVDIVDKKTAR